MNPLHNNHNNNVHGFNITGGSNFPQTTATNATQAGRFSNNNRYVPSCNCNNDISVLNNDTSPTRTNIFTDHNDYQQSMSYSTSNNTDIISTGHNHYQQQISCDASNDKVGHNYHQTTPNNVSSPHFYPQYNDQNSSNALNSLGITINSPHATIIITSSDIRNLIQQDHAYSNKSP